MPLRRLVTLTAFLALAAKSFAEADISLDSLKQLSVTELKAPTHHVQGIAVQNGRLWVSSVESKADKGFLQIFELDSGTLQLEKEIQDGSKIHPGGIALDADSIWVPVAEYRRAGSSNIERRDLNTLELKSRFTVDDHIGCVAVSPGGHVFGGNWDARQIYCWDRNGNLLWKKDNTLPSRYQDMKFVEGRLVASGGLGKGAGVIEWLDPGTLLLSRRITAGVTDRGTTFTNEGMDIGGGSLFLLPEDHPSRLFVFEFQPATAPAPLPPPSK